LTLAQTVLVLQTATGRITHKLRMEGRPNALAAAPDGLHVFVGCQDSVRVVSTKDKKVVTVPSTSVEDLIVTEDSRSLFLAMGQHGLQKMDIPTRRMAVVSTVALPVALALTPGGRFLYVNYQGGGPGGSAGHDAIGKFNARTGAFLRPITGLANVGHRLAVSPDGRFLWVSGWDACFSRAYDHIGCPAVPAGIVNVLDTATDTLVRHIPWIGGSFPTDLTFSPDGRVLATSGAAPRFYDSRSFEILAGLPEMLTACLAFNPSGTRAYTAVQNHQKDKPGQRRFRIAVLDIRQ
jgi:DNA-binding beta-propeller fold protein YncE